ncbi:MAG: hypothetical protein J6W92_01605 [Paludibacteraceae bacterium]|nr:hypothetical protein [Paludibacteraceae bacterium]
MKTLKEMYLRNDVLLLFLWKENDEINQCGVWQPKDAASLLLTKSEEELKVLVESANLLPTKLNLSKIENLKVYCVGSIQDLFSNVEFIPR